MRSVWFSIIGPQPSEVEALLRGNGFIRLEGLPGQLNYEVGEDAVMFVTCENYDWVQKYHLEEEYAELVNAIGGKTPTVSVVADVSGRVPGDDEVRLLARCLLERFHGFAFDDYLSYSHAWTLAEIMDGARVDGLKFFDYEGHFARSGLSPMSSNDTPTSS